MQIRYSKRSRKKITLAIAICLTLIVGGTWLAHSFQMWPFQKQQSRPNVEKNNSDLTNPQTKDKIVDKNKNVDVTKTANEVPISEETTIKITQLTQSDGNVTYMATVTNPGKTGTCSAVFTNSTAQPVTKVTETSDGKCGPVSIPEAQFVAIGTWSLTLRYYSNNMQAVVTQEINIK